ncbi:MAG: histidine kinase [Bacteroidetes bacterium]|nr:histidine kinase [Bacteroidota bacterium]
MVNIFKKYIFPALYGLIVYFTIRLLLDSVTGMRFWRDRPWQQNAFEIGYCIVTSYIFIAALNRLFRFFDRRWPVNDLSYKRVIRELLWLLALNLVFQNVLILPMAALTDDGAQWYDVVDINTIPLLYSLIYYGIARSSTFLKAYIDGKVQLEKITNDQLQTELKFLKAQYHPHFLFNALNTIYFQMDENVADAKKSVEKFSELLRYQLYDQQQTVAVSQELHYLQNFIQLQQTRSSERLQLDTWFDPALNGQQVYPLLFMPLVENAFKYVGGDYKLHISAALHDRDIEFKVVNNIPNTIPVKEARGIGLENLKRRLELLYPNRHQLAAALQGNEFTATLILQHH